MKIYVDGVEVVTPMKKKKATKPTNIGSSRSATWEGIAEAMGVSKRTLYYHLARAEILTEH